MKVSIEYVAQMKDAAGTASEELDLPDGASIQDAIRQAADTHGGRLAELLLDESGALLPSALVFVGNDQIEWDDARQLNQGDGITILAPLAGG